jgi:hypothetical protein
MRWNLVPKTGLEPVRLESRGILSPLRLPIPPLRQPSEVTAGLEPANKGFADLPLSHLGTSPTSQKAW